MPSMVSGLHGQVPEVDQHDLQFSSPSQLSHVNPEMAPSFLIFLMFCNFFLNLIFSVTSDVVGVVVFW
jgi:hypothetical protein